MLVVSMLSPSSTWVQVLVSAEQLKGKHQIAIYIPSGGTRSPVSILSYLLTA